MIVLLAFALAGVVAPAATASSTRVDYWLDRDPGVWTGGMVVIRRGGKYWAHGRFFEGRVCLSGRRDGDRVRMKGVFRLYSDENVAVTWRIRHGMPRVKYTVGTPGQWRKVSRAAFISGTTTGDRLVAAARVTTPARWRKACPGNSLAGTIPRGRTYLKTLTAPGTEMRVLFARRGQLVRFAWLPSAGTPHCFRGEYRDRQLIGNRVTNYRTGAIWSQEPLPLKIGRRTWTLGGQRYREIGRSSKYAGINRRALRTTLRACDALTWPAPVTPPSTPPVTPPVNPTPTPGPGSTTPPPTTPPAVATITGNPCSTAEMAPNCAPARVSSAPNNTAAKLGAFGYGQSLIARCWTTGQTITDGNNSDPSDDARTFTSNLWFGIDWNGGRGYVAATWTTKSTSHLGLPAC